MPRHSNTGHSSIRSLYGQLVVIDVQSPFVFLGTLDRVTETFAILTDADAHDLRETSTTREAYVLDAVQHGVNVNRSEVWIRFDEVVCISPAASVVT